MSAVVIEVVAALERRGGGGVIARTKLRYLKLKSLFGGSVMSGCAVSNRFVWDRSLSCLSMFLLAAALVLVPVAEAQDTPDLDGATVADQMYSVGVAIEALELPAASGGAGDLTYNLRPLPPGLAFDAGSRTLSGTPSEIAIFLMTYEVTDADGDTATLTFNILVEEEDVEPSFDGATVADQMYSAGVAIEALELPAASGGNGDLTYNLRPLPPGLAFDAGSRTLSGTPSEIAIFLMTYEVTDADGDTATLTFKIEVDTMPSFDGATVADQSYRTGEAIGVLELPVASSGDGPLTYSLSPEVPGLAFDAGSRTLSGTPTIAGTYDLTYRVEDSDTNMAESDAETLTFTISVELTFAGTVASLQVVPEGEEIEPWVLPAAWSTDELTYSLSPEVLGLTFDAEIQTLSGTPTVAATYELTYRAEDSDGDAAEQSFFLKVDGTPSFEGATVDDQVYIESEAIDPLELPLAFGGNDELTYSLSPEVPGLIFDAASRTLSGTPTVAATYELTYQVADVDGDIDELSFSVKVDGTPSFGDATLADQLYMEGEAIDPLELPIASGGNGLLTYSLSPGVPGLACDTDSPKLSGIPSEAGTYELTYRVEDIDGDIDELSFSVTVDGPPRFDEPVRDQVFAEGESIGVFSLPLAFGGNGELRYSLSPEIPGLRVVAGGRALFGTPSVAGTYELTYRVEDADGDIDELSFSVTVDGPPRFDEPVRDQVFAEGESIGVFALPLASGGNGELRYSLSPEIPGLRVVAGGRALFGTPSVAGTYALTYRVEDIDGDSAELSFSVKVDGPPRFAGTVANQVTFSGGASIEDWVLPSASGGNGALTYSLVGGLPPGLTFDSSSRTISGDLSADVLYAEGYALTYRVADVDGDSAELSFAIAVAGMPSFGDQVVEDQMYAAGDEVSLALPVATGGNVGLTYSLVGGLPPGLTFDSSSRTISGDLSADVLYAEGYALTYRVADVDGDSAELSFAIAVAGMPSFGDQVVEDQMYAAGDEVSLALPVATGGNVGLTYSLVGGLPPGLAFDPASQTISGTPSLHDLYAAEGYALTYRVADADGDSAELSFAIAVNGMPSFAGTVANQVTFSGGASIEDWVLPSASGGNGALTYSLVGGLPPGLTFDSSSRTISGDLSADVLYAEGYALTYRVADVDGDSAELSFAIAVAGMPSFGDQVVEDQMYAAGDEVSLALPVATGGNVGLTYSLVGGLPPGLTFDSSSRTISGDLSADVLYAEGYALTYRVADVDGDSAELSFAIAVAGMPSFGDQVVEDQMYAAGDEVSLALPVATGGNVGLTYSLVGGLPPGLAFDPASQTISGTPPLHDLYAAEGYALTYRVADADGDSAELSFAIAVNGMPSFAGTITNQTVAEGEEMAPLELPATLGGNGELTYSLSPEVPGLVFDAETRTLSGTPTTADTYELTYQAEDSDGDSAEVTFSLKVDGTPAFDTTLEDRIFRQNEEMDPWELPVASGGNGELTYSLSPNVPGLSFDAASRTLSGTPTDTGTYHLSYRVADVDGDSAELRFYITIDGAPSFNGTVANQTYIEGEAIEDLSLPKASGGNVEFGELTYSLAPEVPGLSFDAVALTLSGTPTEVGTYTLTYTAHDEDDNRDDSDAAILSFEVRVEESATDRFEELNAQILSKYALAIADGTNRAIENRLEQVVRGGNESGSFRFAAESTLYDMIQSGRIFENSPVSLAQVAGGSSFAVPFGFGRGCSVCPGSPAFWGRGDYGKLSSDDGSLDWDGNLTRAQLGLDARPGDDMLTGLALSWAQGSFDYTAPLLGQERVDGTYTTQMLSLHPYVGFSPGRLGVWLTAGLGRGDLEIDDEQGTVGQQSSDTSLRTASVGASGDLLDSGPTQLRLKGAATVAQVEVEAGDRIADQTVSANRLRLALKGSHAYEVGMDGQMTPQLEVALRQDGGDGQTGAGVEVGGGLRFEGGGFTLEAMARSLVAPPGDGDYKEWGAHLLIQRASGTGGRGLSLRLMPTYGTQANSLTLWERSVAELADQANVNTQGQLRAEVGYGLAAPGGRGVYTVYSGMTQAPERMQLRLGTRFEVDSSMSVSLESTRWQRMAGIAEHGLLLRGRLVF